MNFGTLKSPYLYSEMLMTMTCFQSWELGVQRWQLEVFPEHKKPLKTREKRMKFKDRKRNCPFSSPIICQTLWYDIMQGRKKITGAQVEVGRDFWRTSGPTTLLKQGHREQVAQEHIQTVFVYFRKGRNHNVSGQPLPVLHHPHS